MTAMVIARDSEAPMDAAVADEAELVARARGGDRRAFEQLYRDHVNRIHALCWRLCGGDGALASDMVQEAFIRAWRKLHHFRGESAFGTWLHRLTVNLVLGEKRKQLRRAALEQPLEETHVGRLPATESMPGVDRDLEVAIARLPERARTVLVLHDIEGYQHDEIGRLAGMAVGTSKAQLHRARRLLREWLES